MITKYKEYTLVLDFSKNEIFVPTLVKELNYQFDDISKAKRYIDTFKK